MKINLGDLFKGFTQRVAPIDPSRFNDELAKRVSWEPLERGGSNMQTHKAVQIGANRIEFQMTAIAKFFPLVLAISVFGFFIGLTIKEFYSGNFADVDLKAFFLPGAIIGFFTIIMLISILARKAIIFDRNYGYYWKGKKLKEGEAVNPADFKGAVRLSEIKALQIIPEWVVKNSGKHTSTYYSYELNLILESAQRVNVLDHGNLPALQEDARVLSEFLGIPIWDASDAAEKRI